LGAGFESSNSSTFFTKIRTSRHTVEQQQKGGTHIEELFSLVYRIFRRVALTSNELEKRSN